MCVQREAPGVAPSRVVTAIGFAATAILAWVTLSRFRYGVDFTDEGFYNAMPYAFALGARPFVDETLVQQTSALILLPLVKVYLAVVGSADGLVLFMRHVYWVASAATAGVVFRLLRDVVDPPRALAVAVCGFLFVPFHIPSLSYNSIAMLSMSCALFTGALGRGPQALFASPIRSGSSSDGQRTTSSRHVGTIAS